MSNTISPDRTGKAEAETPLAMSPFSNCIIAAIHDFIRAERRRNFSFLGKYSHCYRDPGKLLVVSQAEPDHIATVTKEAENLHGTEWFTFFEPVGRSRRTVMIKALDRENVGMQSMVIGADASSMCDAATWMRNTYCTSPNDTWAMKFSEMQYEEQSTWWATTGQSFRLLELPLELREAIYLQAIGPVCIPDLVAVRGGKRMRFGVEQSFQGRSRAERNRDPDVPRPNIKILYVNKQVHKEALAVIHRDTTKRLTTLRSYHDKGPWCSPSSLWQFVLVLGQEDPHKASFLRRVQLEMPASNYFASIGIFPERNQPLATGEPMPFNLQDLASHFDGLQQLDLRFISPKHKLARCPWADVSPAKKPHACQKKWIALFFALAWHVLHALRVAKRVEISLSGCIKNSTRRYWKSKLDSACEEDAALVEDMGREARADMQKRGPDAVLGCECTNACAAKSVFADDDARLGRIEGWQGILDTAYWDFED